MLRLLLATLVLSTTLPACLAMNGETATTGATPALPTGSRLLTVRDHQLHVRSLGNHHAGPGLVLLSGPTDHWHADSGWFALLQPLLADRYRVHAIDRAGHGFSDRVPTPSYRGFADDLAELLPQLEQEPVIVVAFASSNLALHHYFARHGSNRIQSVLLIDPDVLHPELISFYTEQAAPFKNAAKLAEYVNAGKYDDRAKGFADDERAHLVKILPGPLADRMDWPFYEAIAHERLDRARILARFAEVANYDADVTGAAAVPWPVAVPVWSYDTDFETPLIAASSEPAEKAKLTAWRDLGRGWLQALPGRCRIGSASQEHLATVAEADRLVRLVDRMAKGFGCPEETR